MTRLPQPRNIPSYTPLLGSTQVLGGTNMITREQAQAVAASHIAELMGSNSSSCDIVDALTIESPLGWMFFYQSRRYLETRDPSDALAGNAPLIVDRLTGKVIETGTAHPPEYYLAQFEAAQGAGAA